MQHGYLDRSSSRKLFPQQHQQLHEHQHILELSLFLFHIQQLHVLAQQLIVHIHLVNVHHIHVLAKAHVQFQYQNRYQLLLSSFEGLIKYLVFFSCHLDNQFYHLQFLHQSFRNIFQKTVHNLIKKLLIDFHFHFVLFLLTQVLLLLLLLAVLH